MRKKNYPSVGFTSFESNISFDPGDGLNIEPDTQAARHELDPLKSKTQKLSIFWEVFYKRKTVILAYFDVFFYIFCVFI